MDRKQATDEPMSMGEGLDQGVNVQTQTQKDNPINRLGLSQAVYTIMLAQPLNPFVKLQFSAT